MDLFDNPFYILGASFQSSRKDILNLAEERSLLTESQKECEEARSSLTNPRKRLTAEAFYLPGMKESRVLNILDTLSTSPELVASDPLIPRFSKPNVYMAVLKRLTNPSPEEVAWWIFKVAKAFENLDAKDLMTLLNKKRELSKFPEISELRSVEATLEELRAYYRMSTGEAMKNLGPEGFIESMNILAIKATKNGQRVAPVLVSDLAALYQMGTQPPWQREKGKLEELIKTIYANARGLEDNFAFEPLLEDLRKCVTNMYKILKPLQLIDKSRGNISQELVDTFYDIRVMAISMHNDYARTDLSIKISKILVPLAEDSQDLMQMIQDDLEASEEIAEETDIMTGSISADDSTKDLKGKTIRILAGEDLDSELILSPTFLRWQDEDVFYDSVLGFRFGLPTNSLLNLNHDDADLKDSLFQITLTTESSETTIPVLGPMVFQKIIKILDLYLVDLLMVKLLEDLKDGRKINFLMAVVSDKGIMAKHKKVFSSSPGFIRWTDANIWHEAGALCVGVKGIRQPLIMFAYQMENNIKVVEKAVSLLQEYDLERLSDLLEVLGLEGEEEV
ncbi:MAG: hypothetical protein LBE27_03120 [Deltaproteobacteria bacterium]|jgi:hypothetical protein|nr:hypothetical protein [Deltaproteobacteria bacterium]